LAFAEKYVKTSAELNRAGVAELVDAPDLGSGAARRGGSSPFTRTIALYKKKPDLM
tara:strand:+ start:715 stop:882 length:168 start_codon:yes stop_codon:yes gene_type:complete